MVLDDYNCVLCNLATEEIKLLFIYFWPVLSQKPAGQLLD
jgi:hypothetical protein